MKGTAATITPAARTVLYPWIRVELPDADRPDVGTTMNAAIYARVPDVKGRALGGHPPRGAELRWRSRLGNPV